MKHLWIYVVFLMVLHFQRIPASDVCFSNEQTSNCYCTSPPPEPFPDRPLFCVTCTVLVIEENVSSSCSPRTSVSYNQQCYFSCPTGYNLIGPSSVICTSSGSFSEPFPRCDEVTCTVHSLGAHVSSSCSPGTSVNYNDLCSFSCQTGFNLIGPSSVTCTSSGSFSEPFPRCEAITCIVPSLEENVSSSCSPGDSLSYNERCNFSCPTGYNLTGSSSVTCTSSANFPQMFPRCEVITCTVPELEENVSSSCSTGTSVSYDEECSFSCPTGFNLIGASSVICTSSGSFSDSVPRSRCEVITCIVPSLEENVSSSCSTGDPVIYNERCNFSCPTGYNLAGSSSVTCTSSANFPRMFPRCEVITCTVPSLEDNVSSSCSPNTSVSYNERCNFSCPTNYSRAGPLSVACTGSGSFSQMFPRCVECVINDTTACPETVITCTVPELEENVSSSTCSTDEYVIEGQQCSFSCPTGYSLAGSSSVYCKGSGNFSEPFPQCEVDCNSSVNPCMNGGTCDTMYSTCTCAPGFTGPLCAEECGSNDSDCPETELGIIDVNLMSPGTSSGRRKRAAVPIESAVVQNLLDSIVIAVDRLPEVISVNGRAVSANDDVIDFITARVRLDVTFGSDITIQQLTLLVIASINNIPGVDVQSFELLTDPCSLDNPCGNGERCKRVEPGSANVTCTPDDDDADDDGITTILAIALPIVFLLLVAICLLAFVYHRYGVIHGRKGRAIAPEPLVQEGTSGGGLQRSSSVGNLPLGNIKPTLAHELKDGLEMDSRLNSDEVDRHDAEVKGLSYRQAVDEHRASSGNRAKESDLNDVPQKELRV